MNNIIFKFNNIKQTSVSFLHVFKGFYDWFINQHSDINIIINDVSELKNVYNGDNNSGFFLTILNPKNKKYIVVSYWDNCSDLKLKINGWSLENCVEIITSVGTCENFSYTPFTYCLNNIQDYSLINTSKKIFEEKDNSSLFFRGKLYGYREKLKELIPNIITDEIIRSDEYFLELTNRKIGLSLNGAAEICHRDFEIMSTGSILFRPKIKTKFFNELIPFKHYIPFDFDINRNPKDQLKIILDTFEHYKNKNDLLFKIHEDSIKWFNENITIESNINILKNIININKIL